MVQKKIKWIRNDFINILKNEDMENVFESWMQFPMNFMSGVFSSKRSCLFNDFIKEIFIPPEHRKIVLIKLVKITWHTFFYTTTYIFGSLPTEIYFLCFQLFFFKCTIHASMHEWLQVQEVLQSGHIKIKHL